MRERAIILYIFSLLVFSVQAQFVIEPGSALTIKDGGSIYINTSFHIESDATASGYLVDQTGSCLLYTSDAADE